MLLLRAGTQQRHRYRIAPAGGSNSSERQRRNGAPTSGGGAPPNSNGRSGAAAGTAARPQRRDRGLDRGRFWPRRLPTSARKALEGKGNLGGEG